MESSRGRQQEREWLDDVKDWTGLSSKKTWSEPEDEGSWRKRVSREHSLWHSCPDLGDWLTPPPRHPAGTITVYDSTYIMCWLHRLFFQACDHWHFLLAAAKVLVPLFSQPPPSPKSASAPGPPFSVASCLPTVCFFVILVCKWSLDGANLIVPWWSLDGGTVLVQQWSLDGTAIIMIY